MTELHPRERFIGLPAQPPAAHRSEMLEINKRLLDFKPGAVGTVEGEGKQKIVLSFAKRHGIKIKTRKMGNGTIGVWKL